MTTTAQVFPDAELIAVTWMNADADITCEVSTELPDDSAGGSPVWPLITLQRVGGTPSVRRRCDVAHLQVNVWGDPNALNGRRDCNTLARTARASLMDMAGYAHSSGDVTGVDDVLGLMWAPDDSRDPTVPRYLFTVAVYLTT